MWVAQTNKPERYLSIYRQIYLWHSKKNVAEVNHQLSMSSRKTFHLLNHFCKVAKYYRIEAESTDVLAIMYYSVDGSGGGGID